MTETINFSRMKKIFVLITGLVVFCSATVPVYTPAKENIADPLKESITRGKEVYTNFCMSCHQETGAGIESSFPPLAKADYLKKFPKESIYAVKFGMEGKIVVNGVTYESMMPNPNLEPKQIADVMNYINNSWGNSSNKKIVTEAMVKAIPEKKS